MDVPPAGAEGIAGIVGAASDSLATARALAATISALPASGSGVETFLIVPVMPEHPTVGAAPL